jgi:hypothetical protein
LVWHLSIAGSNLQLPFTHDFFIEAVASILCVLAFTRIVALLPIPFFCLAERYSTNATTIPLFGSPRDRSTKQAFHNIKHNHHLMKRGRSAIACERAAFALPPP